MGKNWKIAGLVFTYILWSIIAFFALLLPVANLLYRNMIAHAHFHDEQIAQPEHLSTEEIDALPLGRCTSIEKCPI